MKMVRKTFSLLLALMVGLCMTIPTMAAEITREEINGIRIGEPIEGVIERRDPVSKYTLDVPNDGLFHEVSGFSGEYSNNTKIKMTASWLPTFQKVDFEIRDEVNGGAQGFTLSSGGSRTVTLWAASNWGLYVRVSGQNPQSVSGELYIEFN